MIQDSRIKFAFFGTDEFSVNVLEELATGGFLPSLIVTMPDKPKGRGLVLTPPPLKLSANKRSIPVLQPEKPDASFLGQLSIVNCQLFVVASYGRIIPKAVLDLPARGALNVHPSLLPKFRGASPIQSAILADDKKTGVTVMLMDEKMDHGPIVAQREIQDSRFKNQEWPAASELEKILAKEGGKLLAEILPQWTEGKIDAKPQDEKSATYCGKFEKKDALVDLSGDAYKNYLKIKAFDRSPVAYAVFKRKGRDIRVLIKEAEFRDGVLILKKVLPEGKREMSYEDFLQA